MIKRDDWGHLYLHVRGEIQGLCKDKLLRKLLSRTFSLIKNESSKVVAVKTLVVYLKG